MSSTRPGRSSRDACPGCSHARRIPTLRTPCLIAGVFALGLAFPVAAAAQQPGEAAAAEANPADDVTAARDRLHILLLRSDVRRVAREHGIDLRPVHDGVERLGPGALARIAPYADELEAVDNAQDVTISTTTTIIGLLVLILLVLIL